jgi:hypothetical protein
MKESRRKVIARLNKFKVGNEYRKPRFMSQPVK